MIGVLDRPRILMAAAECVRAEDREEAAWIARAKSGDPAAFQWLLGRYRGGAVRLAAHVLRRDGDAEDIAQEAFIRAFRSMQSLRADVGFSSWLYRIVLRICLDRRRLKRWNSEVNSSDLSDKPESSDGFSAAVDRRIVVEMLLDRLSPQMRAALVLRELEGLEYAEISEILGIPIGTVRSRIHAARAQFRALWIDSGQED